MHTKELLKVLFGGCLHVGGAGHKWSNEVGCLGYRLWTCMLDGIVCEVLKANGKAG
jgi:hypothetical protein